MTSTPSVFLKEMGITEWTPRDAVQAGCERAIGTSANAASSDNQPGNTPVQRTSYGTWWFFGNEPQGDAQILFQNMIRALGLAKN